MVVPLNPRFIWSFAKFEGIAWLRESPWNILVNVMTPLCLLVIIYFISSGKLIDFAIVGGSVAIVAATTLSSAGSTAMFRLEFRLQELLVATKINIIDYALGFVVANLVFASPGIALFVAMSALLHLLTLQRLLSLLLVLVALALATTSIAIFVGTWIRRTIGMWAIAGILSSIMTLIAPTFYPYTALPKIALYVMALSPVTLADITLQGAYGLQPAISIAPVLLVLEVLFYAFVVSKFGRWRDR